MRLLLTILTLTCLAITTAGSVAAQGEEEAGYSLLFRGISMQQALEELVDMSGIDLVYSNDLIDGKRVYCAGRHATAEALLQCILRDSDLDYIRSSAGTYIIISSLEAPPLIGDLAGRVIDTDTGDPLPYANILLADASTGTTSNHNGHFRFPDLVSGMHRIVITYVGYETLVDTVWIEPGRQLRKQIELRSREVSVGPIVVDGLEHRLPSGGLGSGSVAIEQLSRISAIGTPDVIRGAGRIAGVGVQQPLASLHIQGSDGNEHVTLLDGAPVRNPVSMGRHLGAFSPLALKRLTVHKAGFGARHGSNLTGYLSVDHDLASADPQNVTLMLDPISTNVRVNSQIRLAGDRSGFVMAAVRTSNWDVYQDQGVQTLLSRWNAIDPLLATFWTGEPVNSNTFNRHTQLPNIRFSDVHLASRFSLNTYHTLSGSLYRASNHLASELIASNQSGAADTDLFIFTEDSYSWLNWVGQIRHDWLMGARSVLSTRVKGSYHSSGYAYDAFKDPIEPNPSDDLLDDTARASRNSESLSRGSEEGNTIQEYTLDAILDYSFSAVHNVEVGLEASYVDSRFTFDNAFITPFQYDTGVVHMAGYVHDEITPTANTTIEPGMRVTYLPSRQTVYAEPRLALRFDGYDRFAGDYALRIAGGVYRQFINQFDLTSLGATSAVPSILFWLPVDKSLAPPRAYHMTFDALFAPAAGWQLGLETYVKWQPRLLTIDYANIQEITPDDLEGPVYQHRFIAATRGRAYGANINLEHTGRFLKKNLQYGFSRSLQRFPDRFDNELLPSPWNVPYRIVLDLEARVTSSLSAEANWISEWGRRWAYRRAYYDFLGPRNLPVSFAPFELDSPENDVLPAYHRLDLGVSYKISSGRFASFLQLFVVNVLDRHNTYDQGFEPAGSSLTRVPRALPGRQFSLSVRVDY